MDKTALQMAALGYATLLLIVATMMQGGHLSEGQASLTLFPATLVMIVQAVRHARAARIGAVR